MPLLEVRDLVAGYGRIEVLHKVSLRVEVGEVVALVGPNGAGKTTFARAVSGLLPARAGTVKLEDLDVTNARPHHIVRRGLAQVPEGRQLFSDLTVAENLVAGALSRADRQEAAEDRRRLLELFPILHERSHAPARLLSGGEQQMLAIARALMSRPRILVLDEPTQGLAPKVVAEVKALVLRLAAQGLAVLVIEQNSAVVRDVSTRAVLIESGHVTAAGTTGQILASPEFHRAYLGVRTGQPEGPPSRVGRSEVPPAPR